MHFVVVMLFFQCLQKLYLRKTIRHYEDYFTVWAFDVFATGMPRYFIRDVNSPLSFELFFNSLFVFFAAWAAPAVFPCIFDFATHRRTERSTLAGTVAMIAMEFLIMPIGYSAWLNHFLLWVQNA